MLSAIWISRTTNKQHKQHHTNKQNKTKQSFVLFFNMHDSSKFATDKWSSNRQVDFYSFLLLSSRFFCKMTQQISTLRRYEAPPPFFLIISIPMCYSKNWEISRSLTPHTHTYGCTIICALHFFPIPFWWNKTIEWTTLLLVAPSPPVAVFSARFSSTFSLQSQLSPGSQSHPPTHRAYRQLETQIFSSHVWWSQQRRAFKYFI